VNRLRRGMSILPSEAGGGSPSTVTTALPNTPPMEESVQINGESAEDEANVEFPRIPEENGQPEPSSPGVTTVSSVSDRSSISQYPRSFAWTDGDKPLPTLPISRFLSVTR